MDSPIRPEFLNAFAAGSLEIHCSMILLRQNKADGGHEFQGPGVITVARDRDGFNIRLYSDIQDPLLNWTMMAEDFAWPDPGIILPPDSFYSLEATSLVPLHSDSDRFRLPEAQRWLGWDTAVPFSAGRARR